MSKVARCVASALAPVVIVQAIFSSFAAAKEAPWQTNFEAAQDQAKTQKKNLLVAVTGSDWCPWCRKLKSEVFDKAPFPAAVRKHFVLVNIDFPHEKKLPDVLKAQNERIAKKYAAFSYPTVLLLRPDGELMARTGYIEGGPQKYLDLLADMLKTYEGIAPLRVQLPDATGIERAKILDQLIQDYTKLGNQIGALVAGGKRSSRWTPTMPPG